jgi:transcriptional regulator with XRE-family HTH domain
VYHICIELAGIFDKIVHMNGYQTVDGRKLKEARQRAMISQEELSRMTGVGRATISNLENEERSAQPRTVRRLAEALGVEPHDLLREDG